MTVFNWEPPVSFYALVRRSLFRLDAERSHEFTLRCLERFPRLMTRAFAGAAVDDPVELMGLRFRNRVGLAAGLDKDGRAIEAFDRLGFGFIEVGTVTPRAQPGNPRPRMFRLPQHGAIINRMGFNNAGVEALVARVQAAPRNCVLGINIGKNRDTPLEHAVDDYLYCLEKVYPVADYVVVNISSPNTEKLRDLQQGDNFRALLGTLCSVRDRLTTIHGRRRPLVVKLSPDLPLDALEEAALAARELGVDALIATNTTVSRPGLAEQPLAEQRGGLSGAPLQPMAQAAMQRLRNCLGQGYPLIGAGGIDSPTQALARRDAGADLLQLYTGFIYHGPTLVQKCAAALQDAR